MKSREDFINSVWEKSQLAQEQERIRKDKHQQRYRILLRYGRYAAVVSACMIVGVGLWSPDFNSIDKSNGSGELAKQESYTECNGADEIFDDNSSQIGSDGFVEKGASFESELRKESKKEYEYYYLPIAVEICEINVSDTDSEEKGAYEPLRLTGDSVIEAMEWFYKFPESSVYTQEEYEQLERKKIEGKIYKFTMDCSDGADSEGVDRIFYVLTESTLPEF